MTLQHTWNSAPLVKSLRICFEMSLNCFVLLTIKFERDFTERLSRGSKRTTMHNTVEKNTKCILKMKVKGSSSVWCKMSHTLGGTNEIIQNKERLRNAMGWGGVRS